MNLIDIKEENVNYYAYIYIMPREIQEGSKWSKLTPEQRKAQVERTKNWRERNKERTLFLKYKWKQENLEKHREMEKKSREKRKEQRKEFDKERNRQLYLDPIHRIKKNQQRRLQRALQKINKKKTNNTLKYIGCTSEELRTHIEKQFQPGMNWNNYGFYGWHIDHIIPQASFDFSDEKQIEMCMNYKNLQPMWWDENIAKSNRENSSSNRQDIRTANPDDVGSNPTEFSKE